MKFLQQIQTEPRSFVIIKELNVALKALKGLVNANFSLKPLFDYVVGEYLDIYEDKNSISLLNGFESIEHVCSSALWIFRPHFFHKDKPQA
jgi:hypothetical protein